MLLQAAAIPSLEKAWMADPSNYANGYNLALVYLETGTAEKSRSVIQSLIKRQDKPELRNLLGDVEESEGHVNEAARQYEMAARMDPSEKNLFDLGTDLLKHRAFAPGLKVFQFGVERYQASARVRVGLGIAYYSLGEYDNAVKTLCKAVDLDPSDPNALDFLGKMHDVSPQYASEVTARLAHFAATYPQNSAANYYYALSVRQRTTNETSKKGGQVAEKYLLKAIKLDPHFADAHFELGRLYEDQRRENEAIEQYQLAVKDSEGLLKAHYHLARLYEKAGEKKLAQEQVKIVRTLKH